MNNIPHVIIKMIIDYLDKRSFFNLRLVSKNLKYDTNDKCKKIYSKYIFNKWYGKMNKLKVGSDVINKHKQDYGCHISYIHGNDANKIEKFCIKFYNLNDSTLKINILLDKDIFPLLSSKETINKPIHNIIYEEYNDKQPLIIIVPFRKIFASDYMDRIIYNSRVYNITLVIINYDDISIKGYSPSIRNQIDWYIFIGEIPTDFNYFPLSDYNFILNKNALIKSNTRRSENDLITFVNLDN